MGRVGRIIFAWCAVTLLLSAALGAFGQEAVKPEPPKADSSAAPDDGMALSEIEGLKYELLNARFTALQKEIDLLMEKYRQSREVQAIVTQQQALIAELGTLTTAILEARKLHPQEHRLNWELKKIEPIATPPAK